MFNDTLDLNSFYAQGYFVTSIDRAVADAMLEEMKREAWVSVIAENNEGDDNPYARKYSSRFVAADSLFRPLAPKPLYAAYRDAFYGWASAIFERFDHADRALVTALAGGVGYNMDLHADAGDRSLFTTLLYLGHDVQEPNQFGGDLDMVRVDARQPHTGFQALLETIAPVHGRVVVMNNLDPTVYHRVTPYTRPGGFRYQLFGSFGINDSPDWHLPTEVPEAMKGQIANASWPVTMGDGDRIAQAFEDMAKAATNKD